MKLTFILLIAAVFNVTASVYAQSTKIDLELNNATLEKVFQEIQEKTEFDFFYKNEHLPANKTINKIYKNEKVDKILSDVLESTGLIYKIINKDIVITYAGNLSSKETKIQDLSISGKVTDQSGFPLPGVTVVVKGTTQGTITDADGNYTLSNVPSDATLVFSFVGMKTQEIPVAGKTTINVTLAEEAIGIEEVVAIGYGTIKKNDLTGSVVRLKGDDFKTQANTQISEMLTGTIAGFYGVQSTSASGGSSMEIRGATSLSAGTSPLIVLDGVIYNGSLSDINPNDIESLDVLKDASSSAIFGAKAASGVVIITTTKGDKGAPKINFSIKFGISEAAKDVEPLDIEEYLQFKGDYLRSIDNFETPDYYYMHPDKLPSGMSIDEWRDLSSSPNPDNEVEYLQRRILQNIEVENYLAGEYTDWYKKIMQRGLRKNYDINIKGGAENINYYWSLDYTDNEGIILGDKFSAIRSRMNFDFSVSEWMKVGMNLQFSSRDESSVLFSDEDKIDIGTLLTGAYNMSPLGSCFNDDGSWTIFPLGNAGTNPLMDYFGIDREKKINSLFASIYASIDLPFGFNYKLSFQPRFQQSRNYKYYGDQHKKGFATYQDGYAIRNEASLYEWMVDNLLTWKKEIGDHSFDFTFLYNTEKYQSWSSDISNATFTPNQNLGFHALQYGSFPQISNDDVYSTGDAIMARLNYVLSGKYLLTASVRRDGYSAFGQENPRATFPALAFAWKISEENFYKIDLISRMKLRLSWGVNGNRDIGRYSALANLDKVQYYNGSAVQIGVYNSTLANSGLRWERTEAINLGLDMGMLGNRIDLSLDYYDMTTTDLLMERNLPSITGFSNIMSNLGELKNRGFDLTLNTVNINKSKLNWRSSLVFSLNRNKINKLFGDKGTYTLLGEEREGELPDFSNRWFPGEAIDVVWDYNILGVWQEDEAGEAAQYGVRMGDYKVVDVNDDSKYTNLQDKQFIGYTKPRYRFGLRNDFSFLNNFTASIFIRADLGHIAKWTTPLQTDANFGIYSMADKPYEYWMPENPTENSRLDSRLTLGSYGGGIAVYKPRSFVRIQDLSVSYNLPDSMAKRLLMNSMNVYCSVRNLYCFDKWPDFDPESGTTPMPRTFTVGLNFSL